MMKVGYLYQVKLDDGSIRIVGAVTKESSAHGYFEGVEMFVSVRSGQFNSLHAVMTRRNNDVVRLVPEPLAGIPTLASRTDHGVAAANMAVDKVMLDKVGP